MAMIIGRPLDPSEEIGPLSPVVQEVVEVAAVPAGDLFPSVPEVIDDASEPAAAPYVFEEAPTEPPVDEPPADEPPVDEPVPDEPPAEEPPVYDPPVQDPPAEEPSEETPPMWVRATIEKMARTRQERPAAPAPRPADMRGPDFEISEEPEHELAAETTTLSDIARELGLSIPVPDAKAERWVRKQEAPAAEEIEAGWEEEETAYGPPPPAFEAAEIFTPLPPQLEPEPPPAVHSRTDRDRNPGASAS